MNADIPAWPPAWVEDHTLAVEQEIEASGDITLSSALRGDDRLLIAVSWLGGRRYLLVDPIGNDPPQALRAGTEPMSPELRRTIDRLWSQALALAKALIEGELDLGALTAGQDEPKKRRPWRRGNG